MKRYLPILIISILLLIPISYAATRFYSSGPNSESSIQVTDTTPPPTQLRFASSEAVWNPNSQHSVSISFEDLPEPAPKVVEFVLHFNPKLVQLDSTDIGELWTETNILTNAIDNERGEVSLSIGQGFDATPTGNTTIAAFNFSVLDIDDDDNIILDVDPTSKYYTSDDQSQGYGSQLTIDKITIRVENAE